MSNRAGGRPWGDIRAVNPQAHRLASFLRARVDESGKTLATLSNDISMSTSQISTYLGGKIPTQRFVTALVKATVPAPLRDRRQTEVEQLLYDALHPARPTAPAPQAGNMAGVERVQAQQIDLYDRLTRALEQQAELRQAADKSASLVMVLLGMIYHLERRAANLTEERDRLQRTDPTGQSRVLEATQEKLARTEKHEDRARDELERAKRKQRQAEELAQHLQRQINHLTEQLNRQKNDEFLRQANHGLLEEFDRDTSTPSQDSEIDDVEAALTRATSINDAEAEVVERISLQLGNPEPPLAQIDPVVYPARVDPPTEDFLRQLLTNAQRAELTNDLKEAGRLYLLLADAAPQVWGPSNPNIIEFRIQHAQCVGKSGRPKEAVKLLTATLESLDSSHGPEAGVSVRSHLGYWCVDAGDPEQAVAIFEDLVSETRQAAEMDPLGPFYLRSHLGAALADSGMMERAVEVYTLLISDMREALGNNHPEILITRRLLARSTGKAGDAHGAAEMFRELVADTAHIKGAYHQDTLVNRRFLCEWTAKSGDLPQAAEMLDRLLADMLHILGPRHLQALLCRRRMAWVAEKAGDTQQAIEILKAIIPEMISTLGDDDKSTLQAKDDLRRCTGLQIP
ncbi:hypothetical protein [Streptomyces sp. NPDC026092]|uniref:hypothetical protein n=1 Tax=Streptomyces sp. NPDC026092 TaxID=3154797 RepID=UPI0033E797EB